MDKEPPTVTIVSPSKADAQTSLSKSSKVKIEEKVSKYKSIVAEQKKGNIGLEENFDEKKKTAEKPVVNRKEKTGTIPKSAGGDIYKKGADLFFEGYAVVGEDTLEDSSLRWTSDIEGEIGRGYTFTKSDLSEGEHQIVLTATDSEGGVGRDTVNITIEAQTEILGNKLPIVKILSLEEGWSLLNTTELILRGVAEDPEDGELEEGSLVWKSSKDGVLGTGSPLDITGKLSLGDHTITLMATDSDGNTGQSSVNISITDKIDDTINNSPVANINITGDILSLLETEILSLDGSASDPDGEIVSMVWISNIDDTLGTGATLEIPASALTLGDHTITFTATDDNGATDSDNVEVTIEEDLGDTVNKLPDVVISNVEDILTLLETETLSLIGNASDPDGEIVSMIWTSDSGDTLGTGETLEIPASELTLGDHTITFTATDDDGATGSDRVDLTIHKPPVADIISPAGGEILLETDELILDGSGSDEEDGTLDGASLAWSSDIDGALGTGSSLNMTGKLSIGDHTITLTATDSEGATGQASVDLTIHKPPVADILSPNSGEILLETDELILEGSGSDEEDGTLSGESLTWISSIDDTLGTGSSLNMTGKLSIGDHTITLIATDSEGATGSDEVTITVNLAPPTNLTAEALNSTTVQLSWQDNSNFETNFVVEQNSEVILKPDKNITSVEVTNLLESTSYEFRVAAEDNNGRSDFSELVTVETLPAQITRSVSADNTLDSSSPDSTIKDNTLPVGIEALELSDVEYRAALQFAELQDDVSGRIIEKAELRLYGASILSVDVNLDLAVNAFIETWDPSTITWNNHEGKYTLDDQSEKSVLIEAGEPIVINITTIAKNWAAGTWDVNGLLVRSLSDPLLDIAEFESLDTGGSEGLEPEIIVEFGD